MCCLLMIFSLFLIKSRPRKRFFHIFNTLHDAEKQIVFSSDAFPHVFPASPIDSSTDYPGDWLLICMYPRLRPRLPSIKKKAEHNGETLSDEVAQFIASRVVSNVRELEGSLIRVMAFRGALPNSKLLWNLRKKY